MSDKIREAFDAWVASIDKRRDANGWEPLTARDVNMLREGYMEAAPAPQPAPAAPVAHEPHTFWALFDATAEQRFIKKMLPEGFLAFFDCERDARLAKARNPGTDYKRIDYYTAPPAAEQPNHSGDANEMVWCSCGDGYQANSYGAGFIDGSGMCQNCDAALPARDITAPPAAEQPNAAVMPCGTAVSNVYEAYEAGKKAAEQPDTWTPSGSDYDRNIHYNPDAMAWADLFVATFPGLADKHDLMLGWFANAMMAMHDFLKSEQPDTVMVPRELLDCAARSCANGWIDYPTAQELRALLEKK